MGPAPLPGAGGSAAGLCRLPRPCVYVRRGARRHTLPCVWVWRGGSVGTGLLLLLPPALWGWELWGGRALPPPLSLCLCVEWERGARPCSPLSVFFRRRVKVQPGPCTPRHPSLSHPFPLPAVEWGAVTGRQSLCTHVGAQEFALLLTVRHRGCWGQGSLGVAGLFPHGKRLKKKPKPGERIWGSKDDTEQHGASSGPVWPTKLLSERDRMGASLRCLWV